MVAKAFELSGKTAIVAGDSRFWTKYATLALAEAGADIVVAAKDTHKLEEAVHIAKDLGRKAVAIPTDTTQSDQVRKMVDRVAKDFGKIDILVNAADTAFAKPILETSEEELRRVMDANFTSVFLCCQAVGKHMIEQKKGRIINMSSCLAERGVANGAAYCAAAGSVLQLTRVLDLEWATQGITVNAIGAGWMSETDTTGVPQEDKLLRYIPVKRYGHPKEIGSLLVYLASDATDFLTGQILIVDGAVMAHL